MKFREYFGKTAEVYDLDMNIETANVWQMTFMMKQTDCEKKKKNRQTQYLSFLPSKLTVLWYFYMRIIIWKSLLQSLNQLPSTIKRV